MKRLRVLQLSALALLVLATVSPSVAQSSFGFAAYSVTVTLPSGQHTALVNESAAPSSRAGFSDLTIQVSGGGQNLSYSRLVNASSIIFPVFPSLASQSFDYANGTMYDIKANVTASGTADVDFQGTHYTLNVYSVVVSATYQNRSVSLNGTVEAFPLLVYSASLTGGGMSVQATLKATNLPLVQADQTTATAAYVGAGLGVGGIALAAVIVVRRREAKSKTRDEKPMHWVD